MLPQGFKSRMSRLLGDDYPLFEKSVEEGEAVRGVRVNLIKTSVKDALALLPSDIAPLPYCDNGFIFGGDERVGNLPEHHSGMIYMQDPGAMASLCSLDIKGDWWVADLCAAPGGKSSQAAERLSRDGYLLANEIVPSRAKIIVSNMERLGISRATVTSEDTEVLARLFKACFDLVITDAPCSGEGMFRKSDEALQMWSEDNVRACAERQKKILENAAVLVKEGGYLLYSTCTYSIEENEDRVRAFLIAHPDFEIEEVTPSVREATADGISSSAEDGKLGRARRFYPHISPGEGQFFCLMKRECSEEKSRLTFKDMSVTPNAKELDIYGAFCKENLTEPPKGELRRIGDRLCVIPSGIPVPPCTVMMSGVILGQIKGRDVIPSHQFYSAFGRLFKTKIDLRRDDPRLEKYLRGEEIDAVGRGLCAVLYEGVPLGGGKISDGKLKNHYPKGLRNK